MARSSALRLVSGACATILAAAAAASATAQEAPAAPAESQTIEELVVTARKRSESLQDVPISISAVSANDIAAKGAVRMADVFESLPNVSFDATTLGAPDINIRGVSSSTNNLGIESAVGLYVDEVYLARPVAFNQSALDIARIEVLRGPQGTLFGRNTIGGVISITTTDPSSEFTAHGDLTAGAYNLRQARGTVSGPITDSLGFLISASRIKRDGWFDQRTPGLPDYASEDASAVRGKLRFVPSDAFDATLSLDYSKDKSVSGVNEPVAGPFSDFDDGLNDSIATNENNRETRSLKMASLRMNYHVPGHTITSVTGYQKIDYTRFNDQDYTALDILATGAPEKNTFFSQELRIASESEGPFNYLAGVYVSDSKVSGNTFAELGADVPAVVFGADIPGYSETVTTTSSIDAKTYAGFVSLNYKLSDAWELAGGLRYTKEEKTLDYVQTVAPFLFQGAPVGIIYAFGADVAATRQGSDDSAWSGDASLTYSWTRDVSAYGRYSRGYKAGGFDSTLSADPNPGNLAFAAEFVDLFEGGFKSRFFDGRGRFNAAIFYMKYSDKQEQIFNGANFLTSNAASAEIKGAEAELTLMPIQDLKLDFNLGYTDATYGQFIADPTDPANTDYSGNSLPGSAKWSGSVAAEYSFALTGDWRGVMRGEANYRSASFTESSNDPAFRQASHVLINARAGVEKDEGRYGFYVWGRNLTDERYTVSGFNFLGSTYIGRNMPQTWGVELRARY